MLTSRAITKLLTKSQKAIEAKALTKVDEFKTGKLSDANFIKVLDMYREKLASADKKELKELTTLPDIFFTDKKYKLTPFQEALVCYTTALIYNTDADAIQDEYKLAIMRFDILRREHPKLQTQFVASQALFANRFVLHVDPTELIARLRNPEAHLMLDANQDYVVKMFGEISASFAYMGAFQYITPCIMGYLVNSFYLPQAEIKSQSMSAPETSYLAHLTARQVEVEKYDHIYDPFMQQHKEPIAVVLDKSLDDFDGNNSYLTMRLMNLSVDEMTNVEEWKAKNLSSDHKQESKTTDTQKTKDKINQLRIRIKFHLIERNDEAAFELMNEAIKLHGDIANCPVLLACGYYDLARILTADPSEQARITEEFQRYLNEKVAINQPDAMYYKALELMHEDGQDPKREALKLLKQIPDKDIFVLKKMANITEDIVGTDAERAVVFYCTEEFTIKSARAGSYSALDYFGREDLGSNVQDERYLREASRFSHNLSIRLAEAKLMKAVARKSIEASEFADVVCLYEQYLKFNHPGHGNDEFIRIFDLGRMIVPGAEEMDGRKLLKWVSSSAVRAQRAIDISNNIKVSAIETLFATLDLSQQMQLLYVAIKLNPAPVTRTRLVERFNALALKDGALEYLPDPLSIDFLNQDIKDKFAAKRSARDVVSLTRVHGAFKHKHEEKSVEEIKSPACEAKR